MSNSEHYDVLVLGSGEAGKFTAWTSAKEGLKTGVIERGLIGGSCPNIACLPSKNIIHSAKVADFACRAAEFGVRSGRAMVDMAAVRHRKRQMVEGLVAMHLDRYHASGAELIMGQGRFVAAKTIEVHLDSGDTRTLYGDRVCLNTGTSAAIPDVPGLVDAKPLTHIQAMELDRLPEHLLVLGGGYMGLELGQAFARFGSRVTILQRGPQLLSREDADVAAAVLQFLREDGIEVQLQTKVTAVEGHSGARSIRRDRTFSKAPTYWSPPGGSPILEASDSKPPASRWASADISG